MSHVRDIEEERTMKDRAMGIENEYAWLPIERNKPGMLNPESSLELQSKMLELLKRAAATHGYTSTRLWLPCGGCVYQDLAKFEWASPECRRVRDVVLYNKVGERVVDSILYDDGVRVATPFKTNVAPASDEERRSGISKAGLKYVSMGCHENYMLRHPTDRAELDLRALTPFLVTRQVYGGAGWWKLGPDGSGFLRSQRAYFTDKHFSTETQSNRGIICTKKEPLSDIPGLHRLHLIMGDANMLEYPLFLKVGATSILLSMLEDGCLPYFKVMPVNQDPKSPKHSIFSGSVRAFYAVASVKKLTKASLLVSSDDRVWRSASPLEVQSMYCELAKRYVDSTRFDSKESEHEARWICSAWRETLDALKKNDKEFLTGRVDWYTKLRIARRMLRSRSNKDGNRAMQDIKREVDTLYHEIGERTYYTGLVKRGIAKRVVSDPEIEEAIHRPPPATAERGTRASIRGELVRRLMRCGSALPVDVDWNALSFKSPMPSESFPVRDPLKYNVDDLDRFLSEIEGADELRTTRT